MTIRIPENIIKLSEAFGDGGFEVRVAGGAVRDSLLGVDPKDWDLCTPAVPDRMMEIGEDSGIRTIPTGIDHGTISFLVNDEVIEVTTLRIDENCDGRHATVSYTDDWAADAQRRDLTINGLMLDMNGTIHDYVGGREDIEKKQLRFIGDPEKRVQEDYLRMMRYFRFATKFKDDEPKLDEGSVAAIKKHADKLSENVSAERIWTEVKGIYSHPRGLALLDVMEDTGLAQNAGIPIQDKWLAKTLSERGVCALGVLASQMRGPVEAQEFSDIMRASTDERKLMTFLTREIPKLHAGVKRNKELLTDGVDRKWLIELAKIHGSGVEEITNWKAPDFPVSGKDLIELGLKPGPDMGRAIAQIKTAWKDSGFSNDKEELLAVYKKDAMKALGKGKTEEVR